MTKKKCECCNRSVTEKDFTTCKKCFDTKKTGHNEFIVNSLLTYVKTYYDRATPLRLKIVVASFYRQDEVETAKDLLLEVAAQYNIEVGDADKDRQTSSNRSAKEAAIDDIVLIMKLFDQDPSNIMQTLKFCADDIRRLPAAAPEETDSALTLFEELAEQKNRMEEMNKILMSLMGDVSANKQAISKMSNRPQAPASFASIMQQQQPTESTKSINPMVNAEAPALNPPMANAATADDGFKLVTNPKLNRQQRGDQAKRQPRRAGAIKGSSSLKAGPTTFQMQITNVHQSLDAEAIKQYIKETDEEVVPSEVTDTSSHDWETKRFLITFKFEDFEKVMTESFWPEKIYFRQWYPAKKRPEGVKLTTSQ